jgi:hypothetical protein
VDAKNHFMKDNGKFPKYGGWIEYGNKMEPVATVVANEFGDVQRAIEIGPSCWTK